MNTHSRRRKSSTKGQIGIVAFLAVLVVLIAGFVWALQNPRTTPSDEPATKKLPPRSTPSLVPTPSQPNPSSSEVASPVIAQCRNQASSPFAPTSVRLLGVAEYPVDSRELVKTPSGAQLPVPADENLTRFATVTGDLAANDSSMVRLTAHTYEGHDDALGNVVTQRLPIGAIILLHGDNASEVACYRVAFRDKVNVAESASAAEAQTARRELNRYNGVNPHDDLGIMVCANKVGPGEYTQRLNVFAERYGV